MNQRLRSFLSIFLFFSAVHAADPSKNPDIISGTWTTNSPNSGSTSFTPSNPTPKGPELTPNFGNHAPQGNGKSSYGGILGFLFNMGKPNKNEVRMDDARRAIDKAESKIAAKIPLSSEDYAALGTADMSKESYKNTALPFADVPLPFSAPAPINIPSPSKLAGQNIQRITFTVPKSKLPEVNTGTSIPIGKHGITCLPQFPHGTESLSGGPSNLLTPTPITPSHSQGPTFLSESPLNGSGSGTGGGGGAMTIIGGAGAMAAKTMGAPSVMTAAGGAGGGATITTTTTTGGLLTAATPVVIAVGGGLVLGYTLALMYDGIFNPGIGWFPTRQERLSYYAARDSARAIKAPSSIPQPKISSNVPTPASSPNPKKPEEPKERKFNNVQRSDAMRKVKDNYRYEKSTKSYKLKDNGKPIKCSRTGKPVEHVSWDGAHGDIEAWRGPRSGDHMGSLDPETFTMYKGPANDGRNLL